MTEVINATLHQLITTVQIDELIAHVPAPDFPTGGILCSASGAQQAYRTGRGIVHVRARADFEPMPNDRWRIVIDELPYQVNKAREIERIAGLVKDKKILGISDLRDESDRKGMLGDRTQKRCDQRVAERLVHKPGSKQFGMATWHRPERPSVR